VPDEISKEFRMLRTRMFRRSALAALLPVAVAGLAGCASKGPAQRAGADFDRGVRNAKDAIDPAGPVEKAGRGFDRALGK